MTGANLSSNDPSDMWLCGLGYSVLHWAAMRGEVTILKSLVEHNARLDAQSRHGYTPLMLLIARIYHTSGLERAVGVLVTAGCNVNLECANGSAPLHMAVGAETLTLSAGLFAHIRWCCNDLLCAGVTEADASLIESRDRILQNLLRHGLLSTAVYPMRSLRAHST